MKIEFEPIFYDYTARIIGQQPWNVSRSAELLARAHLEAMKTYKYKKCVVGLDIYNVEAEAYGCEILEPEKNGVPIAGKPIFSEVIELMPLRLDPHKDGRIPMIIDAAQRIKKENPKADIRIPLSGPFTIACHLLGMENMICELFTNPEQTVVALMHLAENQLHYGQMAVEKGFKISLFESSVTPPLLSPKLFSDRVLPFLNKILSGLKCNTQLIIGGDTVHILDAISSLSPSYIICPVETNQEMFMSHMKNIEHIHTRINMNPAVFLEGKSDAAIIEAKRVLNLVKKNSKTSIGTLIPFEADSKIIHKVSDYFRFNNFY